jgi:SAM-dependent methyltransferase
MTQEHIPSAAAKHAPYGDEYTAYQLNRSPLRHWVRRHYLQAAAKLAKNATLDFGCGIGELLARLPAGSMGIEYNPVSVDHCRQRGLDVRWYDGFSDDFSLKSLDLPSNIETLLLSHVLEHFDDPVHLVNRLVAALAPALRRIVLIVPGEAGFRIDPTHRTYVDIDMVLATVQTMPDWRVHSSRYFPLNHHRVGNLFPYNELQVVIDRTDPCGSSHQRLP